MSDIRVPELTEDCVIRHVKVGNAGEYLQGHRLLVWDPHKQDNSHNRVCFAFFLPGEDEPLFVSYVGVPFHLGIDCDEVLHSIMSFVCMREGDTDKEFFEDYPHRMLDWTRSRGYDLDEWGQDEAHYKEMAREYEDYERPRFIDLDHCHGCGNNMNPKGATEHHESCDRAEWNHLHMEEVS